MAAAHPSRFQAPERSDASQTRPDLAESSHRTKTRPARRIALALLVVTAACQGLDRSPSAHVPSAARGEALYGMHCAVCHGVDGDARGAASAHLFPPARDFGSGHFRLVSTENGVATKSDLVETLRRGMPGSAMPSWGWLEENDLESLAEYVQELTFEGMVDHLRRQDPNLSEESARENAQARLRPGKRLATLWDRPRDEASQERGREVYELHCIACHEADGSGRTHPTFDEDGTLNWPRDFTVGFMKGSASPNDLANRIRAGIPGTAMPGTALEDDDLTALVAYVRTLIPEGAEHRLVQARRDVIVKRVPAPLPEDSSDRIWQHADETLVALAPLWWREGVAMRASLAAIHDGENIAIRVRWPDDSGEPRVFSDVTEADAVALQFSSAEAPPLFGMGAPGTPTSIWHWRSLRSSEIAGELDLTARPPKAVGSTRVAEVRADIPVYHHSAPLVSSQVDRIEASGVENARRANRLPSEVRVVPRWESGEWEVLFIRPLNAANDGDIEFRSGSRVQVACALWNGAAGDEGPEKSISIWQELVLE